MLARYREVVEIVLHFRESKEKLIRRAVISLIPRLAAFAPERFAATYLSTCTDYLINVVKCAPLDLACIRNTCNLKNCCNSKVSCSLSVLPSQILSLSILSPWRCKHFQCPEFASANIPRPPCAIENF